MSNFSTDCISGSLSAFSPNITSSISACQAASNTTFCWPPNGTRICVSPYGSSFPFYWPISYYGADTKVVLDWNLLNKYDPNGNNTGTRNLSITPELYRYYSLSINGVENERTLPIYLRTKKKGSKEGESESHQGPTVVLVKTREFPSATATSRPKKGDNDDDDKDALTGLTSGGMAGIIIGVLIAIVALVTFCCCYGCCACCGVKKGAAARRFRRNREEEERVVAMGTELMEQKGGDEVKTDASQMRISGPVGGVGSTGPSTGGQDEITRVEEERARVDAEVVRDYIDPPPKYAP